MNPTASKHPTEVSLEAPSPSAFLWLTIRDVIAVAGIAAGCLFWLLSSWLVASPGERIPGATSHRAVQTGLQIDINKASLAEFMLLEGIGPALAQRITDDRDQRGTFKSINDLDRVKGIGTKTIEKNRRWMKVSND